jgi:kynurenine formamidase
VPLYELSHPFVDGMPHHPAIPPFQHLFSRRLGDVVRPGGVTVASDVLVAPLHVGTHIDAFSHVADEHRVEHAGAGAETFPPLLARGVVLDCRAAVASGVHELGPDELADALTPTGSAIEPGDVVLVGTGWGEHWHSPDAYAGRHADPPGISVAGAGYLCAAGAVAVGADTPALEPASTQLGVHRFLLDGGRAHIIENLRLGPLLAGPDREVLFLGLPLLIVDGTASPLRCVAVTGPGMLDALTFLRSAMSPA